MKQKEKACIELLKPQQIDFFHCFFYLMEFLQCESQTASAEILSSYFMEKLYTYNKISCTYSNSKQLTG